jgi:hypothetical protein
LLVVNVSVVIFVSPWIRSSFSRFGMLWFPG